MSIEKQFEHWLNSPSLSKAEKAELEAIKNDEKEKESRFFSQLSFGTAGLRGTMGVGRYRMNIHVVRHATQSFAEVILAEGEAAAKKGVAICYDCRNDSDLYAKEAARILVGNGIPVRLFDAMRPTPEVSFAIRHYKCIAGINITASHNPKEYNGYKVYWSDGAQLPPAPADAVAKNMQKLDVFDCIKLADYDEAVKSGQITIIGTETDELFLKKATEQAIDTDSLDRMGDSFKMVFTPFHGTGHYLIPEALKRVGLKNVICVPEQMVLDGNFPTVASPNPENPEGFTLAVELANEKGADFILASDPDADRVGIMVRERNGSFKVLSGNQTGSILLDYLIGARKRSGKMPKNPVALKSLVSTDMVRKIAEDNGLVCHDTFTGFKFLAEKKDKLEAAKEGEVIFSFEESFGYMLGDFVRDKDAVTAAVAMAEMAAYYASKEMTLADALEECYKKYGYYGEKTLNLVMPGVDGLKDMVKLMDNLRNNPPSEIAGQTVMERRDYLTGKITDVEMNRESDMELKDSNVLRFTTADETTVIVRPSGTEPKVKVYILASGNSSSDCDRKVDMYTIWGNNLANL